MASYSVSKTRNGWRLLQKIYNLGKPATIQIPLTAYKELGINGKWTREEAKVFVSRLNKQNTIVKTRAEEVIRVASRFKRIEEADDAFLPEIIVEKFVIFLEDENFGNPKYFPKVISRWKCAQRLIMDLKIKPTEYYAKKRLIYKFFIKDCRSLDHTKKVIRILNMWGRFSSGQFDPVPVPTGVERAAIVNAYKQSETHRAPSEPITPEALEAHRKELTQENYNWIFVSVWLGLRPHEIDVRNTEEFVQDGTPCVCVFQSKLITLEDEDKWKIIPCIYPEQRQALLLWNNVKRPGPKKIPAVFGKKVNLYGGRKGFDLLMKDRGHSQYHVSIWLGHQSISTTFTDYRNKRVAEF